MMDDFLQSGPMPAGPGPAQPFAMEQMRRELENLHQHQTAPPRTGSPGWAAEFDPGEHARMEAAFKNSTGGGGGAGFAPAEFARFQQQGPRSAMPRTSSPLTSTQSPMMSGYQRPLGMSG